MTAREMIAAWDAFNETQSVQAACLKTGLKYAAVNNLTKEIRAILAGEPPRRKRGRLNILMATDAIKKREGATRTPEKTEIVVTRTTESTEDVLNRKFEELKSAISDYADELVETRNKELVESARKSNLVDYIRKSLSR